MDAADPTLALGWAEEGRLPTLQHLMRIGATARLRSIGETFESSVWPTIITGCMPGKHGLYSWRRPRPGTYEMVFAAGRFYRRPFWSLLSAGAGADGGRRVLLVDVPDTKRSGDDRITEVIGWGQRSPTRRESWPPGLYEDLVTRYGHYPRWLNDDMVNRSARALRRYLRTLESKLDVRQALLRNMLHEHPWDFAFISYSEPHNAGHIFHRYLEPGTWAYDERNAERFRDSLLDVYRNVDRRIGELIKDVPEDTTVAIVSGQGFRLNTNGLHLLPRVLTRLGYQVPRTTPSAPLLLKATRTMLPWSIRRFVNSWLSLDDQERAMQRIWVESTDWSRTRAVAEPEFGYAWIRINLRGREPEGTVEQGAEYDALCEEIARNLRELKNAETGNPAVENVVRRDAFVDGPHGRELPDLYVRWSRCEFVREVSHPRIGLVRENSSDFHWSTHTNEAFFVAAGPRIRPGVTCGEGHITDIAPTLLYLMCAPIPLEMDGDVLANLIEPSALKADPVRHQEIPWENDPWNDSRSRLVAR
jgi:predicted AlkP superfamily phosphohydrolase/phosphomutase